MWRGAGVSGGFDYRLTPNSVGAIREYRNNFSVNAGSARDARRRSTICGSRGPSETDLGLPERAGTQPGGPTAL